jgi:hypothetical protein
MKLFKFYVIKDEPKKWEIYIAVVKNSHGRRGYGIFYWPIDENLKPRKNDYRPANQLRSVYINSESIVDMIDREERMYPAEDQSSFCRKFFKDIFEDEEVTKTYKMWNE